MTPGAMLYDSNEQAVVCICLSLTSITALIVGYSNDTPARDVGPRFSRTVLAHMLGISAFRIPLLPLAASIRGLLSTTAPGACCKRIMSGLSSLNRVLSHILL